MPAIAGGVQLGIGAIQGVVGLINSGKAKREARELAANRPKYNISPLAGDELALAESDLSSGGLSSRAESAYNDLNNQQFSSSLDAILKGGGSVNNVAEVFGSNEDGRLRLAQLQDQIRMAKVNNLTSARRYNTEQSDKAFQVNEFAPYMDKVTANGQARQQAEGMIWKGLDTAGAAGINYASQKNQQDNFDSYLDSNSKWGTPQPGELQGQDVYKSWKMGQYSAGGIFGPPTREDLMQFRIN